MKISKLFHWLYAIVLLLPVFSIGGKMLYVTFNQNAKDSYYGEKLNNFVLSDLTSDDLNSSTLYNLYVGKGVSLTANGQYNFELSYFDSKMSYSFAREPKKLITYVADGYYNIQFRDSDNVVIAQLSNNDSGYTFNFDFKISSYDFTNISVVNVINSFIKRIVYEQNTFMDNAFYYAVNQINQQPIFAWAQDSFLVEPIAYVSELFGLSNTSPLITLLSYWLNMSIIWLCFDIIMYVPLMAHRWLDKGAIE